LTLKVELKDSKNVTDKNNNRFNVKILQKKTDNIFIGLFSCLKLIYVTKLLLTAKNIKNMFLYTWIFCEVYDWN